MYRYIHGNYILDSRTSIDTTWMNKYDDLWSSKYCDGLAIEKVQRPFFGCNPADIKFCAFRKFTFFFFLLGLPSSRKRWMENIKKKKTRNTCKNIQSHKILFTRKWSRGWSITSALHTHTHSMMYVLYFAFCINNIEQKCRRIVILVQRLGKWRPWSLVHFLRKEIWFILKISHVRVCYDRCINRSSSLLFLGRIK